jgi:hypothetical protein
MNSFKTKHMRSANAIRADHEILKSVDGARRAYGRNVKRSLGWVNGGKRFDGVRVWTLKERQAGKWIILAREVSRELADEFINDGVSALRHLVRSL